jgi:hypothetical protein
MQYGAIASLAKELKPEISGNAQANSHKDDALSVDTGHHIDHSKAVAHHYKNVVTTETDYTVKDDDATNDDKKANSHKSRKRGCFGSCFGKGSV